MKLIFPVLIIIFIFSAVAHAIPVAPNEAIVRGTVLESCTSSSRLSGISPEQVLYKVVISVEEVVDVKGSPNFLMVKEGQSVTCTSKEKQPTELFGKKIKARVEYRGDERGGLFWIKQIEIIK